jgi:hypothetical protein
MLKSLPGLCLLFVFSPVKLSDLSADERQVVKVLPRITSQHFGQDFPRVLHAVMSQNTKEYTIENTITQNNSNASKCHHLTHVDSRVFREAHVSELNVAKLAQQ